MLSFIWDQVLINPILNVLVALYKVTGSLGLSLITLTLLIRILLIPVILPGLKNFKKQQELTPELNKLKEKHKGDKKKSAEAQMELFKQHGINPASGCLSQILMIVVLIALFNVINLFTVNGDVSNINSKLYSSTFMLAADQHIETKFGYLDLAKPDPLFILAILSGLLQFVASKMMIPYIEKAEKAAEKTPAKTDDIAFQMQQQSLYLMPIMTTVIGVTLPSGVVLYIVATTVFTIVQQYFVSGWGGMKPIVNKLSSKILTNK